jgi:hypothetical protein
VLVQPHHLHIRCWKNAIDIGGARKKPEWTYRSLLVSITKHLSSRTKKGKTNNMNESMRKKKYEKNRNTKTAIVTYIGSVYLNEYQG